MPIEYRIDHDRRLVAARALGVLTARDLFAYQCEVWSRPEVAGYDELVDMTRVQEIAQPSADGIVDLAAMSASMDPPRSEAKFAIVAPQDLAFGLRRMYAVHRQPEGRSTRRVGVFRTWAEALEFLGVEGQLAVWADAQAELGSEMNGGGG